MEKITIYADENKKGIISVIHKALIASDYEVLQVAGAEYSIPCVDEQGTEFYINIKVIVKGQNREREIS